MNDNGNVEICEAHMEDLDVLMQWRMEVLHEVFSIPEGQSVTELEKENRQYYKEALAGGSHIACFARVENEIVGCGGACLYREMPSPDNPGGWCAYLMNIYVRPKYRRRRIGHAIVRWLTSQAAERGISKIYLETSPAGRCLYEEMGFQTMPDMMMLPTDDE